MRIQMKPADELNEWLDTASEKVKRNVEIVTPKEAGQDYMLHVSNNTNIKEFIPLIGRRQAPTEDRSIPRVCVSPTVLGCLAGYADMESDFHACTSGEKDNNGVTYKGGMKIYAIPFEAALKPNQRMVFDAKHSEEHWLVSYSKETAIYKPETAGKIFFQSIRYFPREGKRPESEGTLYIEVIKEGGIRWTDGIFLKKGYWSIEGPTPAFSTMTWSEKTNDRLFKVEELTKAEYQAVKQRTAALLDIADKVPDYLNW